MKHARVSRMFSSILRQAVYAAIAGSVFWLGTRPALCQVEAQAPEGAAEEGAPGDDSMESVTPEEYLQSLRALLGGEEMQQALGGSSAAASGDLNLADLKSKHQNSVVRIEFTLVTNIEETKFNPTKSERYYAGDEPPHGSGFFISESDILTNAHVVEEARRSSIRIKSPATGNVEFKVDVVGVGGSETVDLAILRLPEDELLRFKKRAGLETIPYLAFGDSDAIKQADPLAIFGYPESSDELKIIQCKVTGREYLRVAFDKFICGHQFLEVGPAGVVQPGNSGGPALNAAGEVAGIPSRGSYEGTQGWLIPSKVALRFLEQVKSSEQGAKELRIPKPGISLTENFPDTAVWTGADEDMVVFELGVVVRDVIKGSLAEEWGVQPNDIIVGFANKQKDLSCALDFKGYRVTTGKMRDWPPTDTPTPQEETRNLPRWHLSELIMMSEPGDEITLWLLRKGEPLRSVTKMLQYKPPVELPHLGTFDKPDFDLWGDFVAQDFNDYNANLYDIPAEEILKGGALITFVEPNSLASRRGMDLYSRSPFGFAYYSMEEPTKWVIVETVNGEPVKNLKELRAALNAAKERLDQAKQAPGYDPAKKSLMKEAYVQIGFRINTMQGRVLHLTPGFPIEEALASREGVEGLGAEGE